MIIPVKFEVITRKDPLDREGIHIECTDQRGKKADWKWAIRRHRFCLNLDNEWEYEPNPSSRDDSFLKRTRYSFNEAKEHVLKYLKELAKGRN